MIKIFHFILAIGICQAARGPVEVTDENGVNIKDIPDSLKRLEIAINFFQQKYEDQWTLVEADQCISPSDAWERVARCDNRQGFAIISCNYEAKVGVSKSTQRTAGESTTETVSNFDIEGAFKIFTTTLAHSKTTGYYWSQSDNSIWKEEVTTGTSVPVPAGSMIDVMHVVGHCGGITVQTSEFKTVEYSNDHPEQHDNATTVVDDGRSRKIIFSVNGFFTHDDAVKACGKVSGATLATMRNNLEYEAARRLIGSINRNDGVFMVIGGKRDKEGGHFFWESDGSLASYASGMPPPNGYDMTYWDNRQPNQDGKDLIIGVKNIGSYTLRWVGINEASQNSALCEFSF